MSIYLVIFFFLPIFYTQNIFHCEGRLLKIRLIMKALPNFNFFIQEINKYCQQTQNSTRKEIYVQYVLFHLDVFNFLIIFYTRNYMHCDEKLVTFRLIFKYLRTFKIFIEDIKKYCKFSLFIYI